MSINRQNLELIIKAAIKAGNAILEVYATDFVVDIKADDSPLTRADMAANEIIIGQLLETGLPLVSEESINTLYNERVHWETFWLVDPLDGTKEFVNRNGEFSVNIALIHQKEPIMGVIYAPVHDLLYFSDQEGAFKLDHAKGIVAGNGDIAHLKRSASKLPLPRLDKDFTVVVSRSHLNIETTTYINKIKGEHDNIRIVSRGSSLKLCMIAEGQADVYPRFGITSEWDTAAGHAIVLAAGGRIVRFEDGVSPLSYNNKDLENPPFLAFPPPAEISAQ